MDIPCDMYNSCSAARPEFRKGEGCAGALAVSEEIAGEEIPMLLPPALLQETNKARRKKEKVKEPDNPARHNVADRSKYGLKDSNTGKNAV